MKQETHPSLAGGWFIKACKPENRTIPSKVILGWINLWRNRTMKSLEDFAYLAKTQGQKMLRIAIVGDTSKRPWTVRVEAYNRLSYEVESTDIGIFEEWRSKLSAMGFKVAVVAKQPIKKMDPEMLKLFSQFPPTGDKRGMPKKR